MSDERKRKEDPRGTTSTGLLEEAGAIIGEGDPRLAELLSIVRSRYAEMYQLWSSTTRELAEVKAKLKDREAELLRVRTTGHAAAHAIDCWRQDLGLDLIPDECPKETVERIGEMLSLDIDAMENDRGVAKAKLARAVGVVKSKCIIQHPYTGGAFTCQSCGQSARLAHIDGCAIAAVLAENAEGE